MNKTDLTLRSGRLCRTAVALLLTVQWFSAHAADSALSFSANGQRVETTGRITAANFTVEAWVKPSAYQAENQFFSQYDGSSGRFIVALRNNKVGMFIGGTWKDGAVVIPLNTWTHIAVQRVSGSTCRIYVNGTLDWEGTLSATALTANANIRIGCIGATQSGFRGLLADVRAWNAVRTQPQIAAAKNLRLTGGEAGLAHYWKLDDGTGSTVYDSKTASANGTIYGATWAVATDLPLVASLPQGAWTSATGGNWSDAANWLDDTVAQGVNAVAYFTNDPPASVTVTNDVPGLLLGSLHAAAPGTTFTGGTLTLTNEAFASRIVATNGAHTFGLPLATTAQGLSVETLAPASTAFPGGIGGPGGVTVNPAASGGGTVDLADDNTFTGPLALGSGTALFGAWPSSPASLTLGPGTLRYTGGDAAAALGLTVNAGASPVRAAVLHTDADLTLSGQILATSGAFIKTGPGTLSFTYPGWNRYCAHEGTQPPLLQNIGANGDSPTQGFSGFSITEGKVVMGVPGQVNVVSNRLDIGLYTTTAANAEKTAELVLNDGTLICNTTFSIGRGNGNAVTAPDGIASAFTMNGGEAFIHLLASGNGGGAGAGFNARSVLTLNGGSLTVGSNLQLGESAGSRITLNVTGGTLTANGTSNPIRIGAGTGECTFNLTGGEVAAAQNVMLAMNAGEFSKGTLNLDGGTLTAANIVRGSGTNAFLNFNGGVFRPNQPATLGGLTLATVRAGGARIDTSLSDFAVAQPLLHDPALGASPDGGLVKLGSGILTLSGANTYTGPTAVNEGTLLIGGSATQTLATAALTLAPGTAVGFAFTADGVSNDRLDVADPPAFTPGSLVALYLADTRLPFTRNGTYTLLTYTGADPAAANLSIANPAPGKTYAFAASGGSVTVTIGNDTANASIWNVDADGDWAFAGNWTVAPVPGGTVRFDDAITAPRAIATAGQTAGDLYFNSPVPYTLGGTGLTLSPISDLRPLISVEAGVHALTAPLTLAADTSVSFSPGTGLTLGPVDGASATLTAQGNGTLALTAAPGLAAIVLDGATLGLSNSLTVSTPVALQSASAAASAAGVSATLSGLLSGPGGFTKTGPGLLALGTANTYTGITRVQNGTLAVPALANGGQPSSVGASSAAAANLVLAGGTLRYTGPGATINRGFTINPGGSKAAILRLDSDLTVTGWIDAPSGSFLKTGPGTLTISGAGMNNVLGRLKSDIVTVVPHPANGDAPPTGYGALSVYQGKVILGAGAGQTNNIYDEILVGGYTTDQAGQEVTGELEIRGGYTRINSYCAVGSHNGNTVTAPTPLRPRLLVSGGTLSVQHLNIAFGYQSTQNTRPVVDITNGTLEVTQQFRFGDNRGSAASPMHATLNLWDGGTFRHPHASEGSRMGHRSGSAADATLNLYGGLYDETADVMMGMNNSTSWVNLHGGVLRVRNITAGNGNEYLLFNGGTLQPRAEGQTLQNLTAATVSTNGAVVDTSLAPYTIAQALLWDGSPTRPTDGGLLKIGTNTLSLTSAANTFNGPVRVETGLLRARLGGTNDLFVAAGAAFDALGERCTVGDLTGSGLLTNGTIAVTGRLDAGTNNAPAGATITVQNLALVPGATVAVPFTAVTNDFTTVTGTLSAEGPGFFDLGRDEANPAPVPLSLTVASYGALSGSFAGWKAVGTGLPPDKAVATVVTAADGLVTLTLRYSGTLIMLQ
jgi:fibronectin-binding autotransporter adhesin